MACGICGGTLDHCPACGEGTDIYESWEERLDSRRHQGSHVTPYQANTGAPNVRQGFNNINGGMRGRQKYSREWNSKYDGPGKGTN